MQNPLPHYITPEEYLEGEETSSVKHEYYDGQIYAMAGGTNAHAILCSNTLIALGAQLLGKTCRAVSSEQRVKVEATDLHVYPDTSVYCADARFDGTGGINLLDPTVIFEVLSRSTSAYDRGDKFDHYKRIETLRDYVLIEQTRVHVEHFHRLENDDWLMRSFDNLGDTLALPSIDCNVTLSQIYEGLNVPEGFLALREVAPDEE